MRFRLKTIFMITFAVAVVCAVFFTLPDWLCGIVLACVAMVTPAALVAGVIYGRGAKRAFAIGCLVSWGWGLIVFYVFLAGGSISIDDTFAGKLAFAAYYGTLILAGSASIGVRRLCYQGRNGIRPPRDCC